MADLLEPLLGGFARFWVSVRVVPQCLLAVCCFDLLRRGIAINAKNFVWRSER
tara:strand:+ start:755 stop:913 length:159 start_codon:yes stop_codon:yes gene_type:complete